MGPEACLVSSGIRVIFVDFDFDNFMENVDW